MDEYLVNAVIREQDDGTWIWCWEMADGAAIMGTADSSKDAEAAVLDQIKAFYGRTN